MSAAVDTWLQRLTPERRSTVDPVRAADVLERAIAAGRRAWPRVALSESELAECLADRMTADEDLDLDAVEQLRLSDLVLARACTLAQPSAIACFRAQFLGAIESALRQLGVRPSEVDELTHLVLEEILVHDAGRPAIAGYSGRGSLQRWVRSVAIRIASKRYRTEQRDAAAEAKLGDVMGDLHGDAELVYMKQEYASAYESALAAAVAALDLRDGELLRHYFIDGKTIDDLARMYDVHRATAARWIGKAREHLYSDVLARVHAELGLSPSEAASIGRLVRSQLDLSFSRLLP